jgi:hypothetical protein
VTPVVLVLRDLQVSPVRLVQPETPEVVEEVVHLVRKEVRVTPDHKELPDLQE